MSDHDEIRELLARYCFALDEERFEDMAALFTLDGVWETAFGTGNGRAGIVAQARSISQPNRPRRVHLTTNIVIDLNGDLASVRSNWLLFQNGEAGPEIGSNGRPMEDRSARAGAAGRPVAGCVIVVASR